MIKLPRPFNNNWNDRIFMEKFVNELERELNALDERLRQNESDSS